jgi:acetyl esterase/lipase
MATVHLHGGGFTGGSKETLAARVSPLAELGYTAVVSQYRLAGQAKWPSQLEDVQAALRWVRANADRLNVDQNRVAVVGYSAGGFLALAAAAQPERPAACVAYYPVSEIRPANDGRAHPLLPDGSSETAHRTASPTSRIGTGFPPTVLFQGTADTSVPLDSTQKLFEQLRNAGVRSELHVFEGQPHIFDNQPVFAEACARLADLFLDRIVVNPTKS